MGEGLLKKQQRRYFFLTFVSFVLIFLLLGILVYHFVQASMYEQVDQSMTKLIEDQELLKKDIKRTKEFNQTQVGPPTKDSALNELTNEKLDIFQEQIILWSADGEILNRESLGIRQYDFENLTLNTENLNTIQNLNVVSDSDQALGFRSVTIPIENLFENSDIAYAQILTNTDQITRAVQNFRAILIVCMLVFAAFSILLSYYLSGKFVQPIIRSWRKQQQFVENASHELRTPLTIIQSKLEGLFAKPNHTILEESEDIALSLNEVQRLSRLTSDLLMLARSDSDAIVFVKESIDSNTFLEKCLLPYEEIFQAEDKHFELQLGERRKVSIDTERFQQLLVIMIDNAMKYTEKGDQIIVRSAFKNNEWLLQIKDTGKGISDAGKEQIFDRFYREEASRNRQSGGYGIGLSIASWIVTSHKGKISVKDNSPKGTIFEIRIPIK